MMNLEKFEALFSSSESDADKVFVASQIIHETLLNSIGLGDEALCKGLNIVIQRVNQINYSTQFLSKHVANSIISDLARLIPVKNVELSTKYSWLVLNFLNKQTIILENDVELTTLYFLEALKSMPLRSSDISNVVLHLRTLAAIIYGNVRRMKPMHGRIIADLKALSQSSTCLIQSDSMTEADKLSLICALTQCFENLSTDLSVTAANNVYLNEEHQVAIIKQFLQNLQKLSNSSYTDDHLYYKVVTSSMKGLQNIMEISRTFPPDMVGHLVDIVQKYSLFGHLGVPSATQDASWNEAEKTNDGTNTFVDDSMPMSEAQSSSPHQGQKFKKPSKMSKKFKQPTNDKEGESNEGKGEEHPPNHNEMQIPKAVQSEEEKFWEMFGTSDSSDTSDSELNQSFSRSPGNNFAAKIRTQSLTLLHTAVKSIDKRTMFGHWHSIFPDRFICNWTQLNNYPLFVIIIRDPSHKMRLAALCILAVLLDGSKQFLMAAEDGAQYHNVAYTPFSVTLGNTIKELHRCLLLTLTKEQVPLVLVQTIKCLGTLVANSPYHRLRPGLLNRSVKFISHFLSHKDANIKVVALTCLGKVVSVHAPLGEVIQLLENRPSKVSFSSSGFFHQREKSKENAEETNCCDEFDFKTVLLSGSITPSCNQTDSRNSDSDGQNNDSNHKELPWLLKSCVDIIMSGCSKKKPKITLSNLSLIPMNSDFNSSIESSYVHVLPVRVEALQVLTMMSQNYFLVVRSHLKILQELAGNCLLCDPDNSIQLHAVKLLEAITSSVLSNRSDDKAMTKIHVPFKEAFALWDYILKGPIQRALSNNMDAMVEMVACECLGNIGSEVFEKLPETMTDFIKTIMLGFSSVTNHHICIGALSAVGRSVNYSCLSKDALFLTDASNAVLKSLRTNNLAVITKAAWVLSNLSDAFVLKRLDDEFMGNIPDVLLLKLLENCIELCSVHDKPRINALRTIGNLLNFLPVSFLDEGKFDEVIKSCMEVIIKYIHSGSVKVRWNACYAFGNIMWNEPVLSFISYKMVEVYKALIKAVKTCKNFKVRISAATVLAIPTRREMFFQGDESKTSSRLFLDAKNPKTNVIGRTEGNNQASSVYFYRYTMKNTQGFEQFRPGNYTLEVNVQTEFGMMQGRDMKVGCKEDCFGLVWEGVLSSLLDCEATRVDFTEMKYKSLLSSRLVVTLLHLLSLVVPGDLEFCWKSLQGHEEMIKKYLNVKEDGDDNDANAAAVGGDDNDDEKPQMAGRGIVAHKVKINDSIREVTRHFCNLKKCASLSESHLASLEGLSFIFLQFTPDGKPDENASNNMELRFFHVYD